MTTAFLQPEDEELEHILDMFMADIPIGTIKVTWSSGELRADARKRLLAWRDRTPLSSLPIINDAWCIACGNPTLFLGEGGLVTCSWASCPDPSASYEAIKNMPAAPASSSGDEELKSQLREDLEEMAISLRSGSTKGRHVTAIFDVPKLVKYILAWHTQQAEAAIREKQAQIDLIKKQTHKLNAALIAVDFHLNKPYPDDPRSTPWTRFIGPRLKMLSKAVFNNEETGELAAMVPPEPPQKENQ